jgi:hypothetical protein
MKVRIYARAEGGGGRHPVAEVRLTDRRERASWLPGTPAPETAYFLEDVQADDPRIREEILAALRRPSVPVARAASSDEGGVRTRATYSADEPHGTPQYWRAAFGLLRATTGLTYDREDYAGLLKHFALAQKWGRRWSERLRLAAAGLIATVPAWRDWGGDRLLEATAAAFEVILGRVNRVGPALPGERGVGTAGGGVRSGGHSGTGAPSPTGDELTTVVPAAGPPAIAVSVNAAAGTVRVEASGATEPLLAALVPQDEAETPRFAPITPTDGKGQALFEQVAEGVYRISVHRRPPPQIEPPCFLVRVPLPANLAPDLPVEVRDARMALFMTAPVPGPEIELSLPAGLWLVTQAAAWAANCLVDDAGGLSLLPDVPRHEVSVSLPSYVAGKRIWVFDGQLRLAYQGTADGPEVLLSLPVGLWKVLSEGGWCGYVQVKAEG